MHESGFRKYQFLNMRCRWSKLRSFHLKKQFFFQLPIQKIHPKLCFMECIKKKFRTCWIKAGACPQDSCFTCVLSCKGINSFPWQTVMFNSCGNNVLLWIWFNNFWKMWMLFWRVQRCWLWTKIHFCFQQKKKSNEDGHKYIFGATHFF